MSNVKAHARVMMDILSTQAIKVADFFPSCSSFVFLILSSRSVWAEDKYYAERDILARRSIQTISLYTWMFN